MRERVYLAQPAVAALTRICPKYQQSDIWTWLGDGMLGTDTGHHWVSQCGEIFLTLPVLPGSAGVEGGGGGGESQCLPSVLVRDGSGVYVTLWSCERHQAWPSHSQQPQLFVTESWRREQRHLAVVSVATGRKESSA